MVLCFVGCAWARVSPRNAKLFPQFKTKQEFLSAEKSDPNVRQTHVAAVDLYIKKKKSCAAAGMVRIAVRRPVLSPKLSEGSSLGFLMP